MAKRRFKSLTNISWVEENMIVGKNDDVIAIAFAKVLQVLFPFGLLRVNFTNTILTPVSYQLEFLCIYK